LGGELREAVDVRTALLALLYMSTLASLDHAFIHMNDTAAKHVTAWPNL
jgi:acyl dehydratase